MAPRLARWPRRHGAAGLTAVLASCASASHTAPPAPAAAPKGAAPVAASGAAPLAERLLVRTADLRVTVEDVGAAASAVHGLAAAQGGYVEGEQRGDRSATITLRVPDTSLAVVLDTLSRLGKLEHRSVSAQDVTELVLDLDARLATLVATRDRLRQLLERAGSVADVVAVERELARVQADVESLQRRLNHLRSSAALSEVRVDLRQPEKLGPLGVVIVGASKLLEKLFVIR